ncbi:MAG: hypothetical protein ACYCO0_03815 [Candidatus Micrarchaeaceae archaeon]
MTESGSDLLIFKRRNLRSPDIQAKPKVQEQKPQPVRKPQAQQTKPQPQPKTVQAKPELQVKPAYKPEPQPQLQAQPDKANDAQKQEAPLTQASQDIENLFCINHPWRHAYGRCSKDSLPYCYVELMDYKGKLYCLNDIDSAMAVNGEEMKINNVNRFSILTSVLLIANSALLAYFLYDQAQFLVSQAIKQGVSNFLLQLNMLYVFPIANILIILLGVVAAITILRKSIYMFGFTFVFTFASLLIMTYEYLSTSANYMIVSGVILLVAISTTVYSRVSSLEITSTQAIPAPEMNWPKPEVF